MTPPSEWRALGEWARLAHGPDGALDDAISFAQRRLAGNPSLDASAALAIFPEDWCVSIHGRVGGEVWTVNASKEQLLTARQLRGRTLAGTILAAACEARAQEIEKAKT